MAYISANPRFFENKTILENVTYPLKSRRIKKQERINIALVTLSNWGWRDKANLKVKDLNYYDKLTLSLIRANVRKLDLLLCENIFDTLPTTVLDKISATTKIVVGSDSSFADDYTPLIFGLGNLKD